MAMLFSDIEGSTLMLQRLGDRYSDLIREHNRVMRLAIEAAGGRVVRITGDSFFAVFGQAAEAVSCAQRAQCGLSASEWPGGEAPRVRMGIHSGAPTISDGEYVGVDVHRAARVMSVAYGGQVLLTEDAVRLVGSAVRVRDLGYHRLKDLSAPEHLFQLLAAGLAADFPPLRSLNRSNLPTPAHRLVGRVEELALAVELLSRQDVRLLTLLGPGGVGKTRMSIELAADAVLRYRDGVWIVALAPIRDQALIVSEIARVLEVAPVAGEPLRQTLSARLAERQLLLVLDNFEHLLEAAGVVAELLAVAPKVDVLCTSREPLRIRGEQRLQVGPLPVLDASELFLQRALAARPELSVDAEDHAAIARICGRLDGLPLALEMAASRAAIFAPRALEIRLAEGLALAEGPRDLPERQRTLHATIDWSYQLLDPDEQALFRSLAPFVGGVRIDSAVALWGPPSVRGLISLAEKSLLGRREDPDGEPRFWMLETVREFALSRAVADGSAETMAAAHAEHYCELTERAAAELLGTNQRRWVDTLEQENPNLRTALDRLTAQDPSRALRMAANLEWFWVIRGYVFEGRGRLVEALVSAPPDAPHRGRALAAAGQLTLDLGEAAEAEPLLLEALELARRDGDARLASHVLSHLGWGAEALGDPDRARAYHVEAIAAARDAQGGPALELALNNYAVMIARLGDVPAARPLLEESLLLARSRGEPSITALTAGNLAIMALDAGELETAEALARESLARAREVDFRGMVSSALALQAVIQLERGNLDPACARLAEAIEAVRSIRHVETVASVLSVAGTIAAMRDRPIQAATLWAAADRNRERVHLAEDPNVERFRAKWQPQALAEARDTSTWTAAEAAGAELPLDDALDLASDATRSNEHDTPAKRDTIAT